MVLTRKTEKEKVKIAEKKQEKKQKTMERNIVKGIKSKEFITKKMEIFTEKQDLEFFQKEKILREKMEKLHSKLPM